MIPGPVEVSPAVRDRFAEPPPGHLAPRFIEAFGASIERMRQVWAAAPSDQPFVVTGGGTLAMDMAAANLIEPGDRVLVVSTGYFSERLAEMLRRRGAAVVTVDATVGDAPALETVVTAADTGGPPPKALFATHVDTSTGVRLDPQPLVALARERGWLSVFDGVCATAGERFEMGAWGADVYLTASQKAVGLPAGLALLVAGPRALEARERRETAPPPMVLDWREWLPVMRAYEERRPAYFSTPATNLVLALEVGLTEILADGLPLRIALHERCGRAMRAAWRALGLQPVPVHPGLAANTMSALMFPAGVDASLIGRVLERGVVVAGGLHRAIRERYFRVGHMGYAVTRPEMLERTVRAVAEALGAGGRRVDTTGAVAAAAAVLEEAPA